MQRTGEQRGKALGRVSGIPEPTGPQGSLKTQHLWKQHGNSVSLPGHLNGLSKEKLDSSPVREYLENGHTEFFFCQKELKLQFSWHYQILPCKAHFPVT